MEQEITLREHLRRIAKIRWEGVSPQKRIEHTKMMANTRWKKETPPAKFK